MSTRMSSYYPSKASVQESPGTSTESRIPRRKNFTKSASSSPRQPLSFRTSSTRAPTSKPILPQVQTQQQAKRSKAGHGEDTNLQTSPVKVIPEKPHSPVQLSNATYVGKTISEEMKRALQGFISPSSTKDIDLIDLNMKISKEKVVNEERQDADMVQGSKTNHDKQTTHEHVSDMDIIYAPSPLRMNSTGSILPETLTQHKQQPSYLQLHLQKVKQIEAKMNIASTSTGFLSEPNKGQVQMTSAENVKTDLSTFKASNQQTGAVKAQESFSKESLLEDTKAPSIVYDITSDCDESDENCDNLDDASEVEIVDIYESDYECETVIDIKISTDNLKYEDLSDDGKSECANISPVSTQTKKRTIFSMDVPEYEDNYVFKNSNKENGDWSNSALSPNKEKSKSGFELLAEDQHPIQHKSSSGFIIENVKTSAGHTDIVVTSDESHSVHQLKPDVSVTKIDLSETKTMPECLTITPQNSTLILSPSMMNNNEVFETSVKICNTSSKLYGFKVLCNMSAANHFKTTPKLGFIFPHSEISIKVRTTTNNLLPREVAVFDKIDIKTFPSNCDDIKKLHSYFEFLSREHPEVIMTKGFHRVIVWDTRNLAEMLKLLNSIEDSKELGYLKDTLYLQHKSRKMHPVQKKLVLDKMWTDMTTINRKLHNIHVGLEKVKNLENAFFFIVIILTAFLCIVPFLYTDAVVDE